MVAFAARQVTRRIWKAPLDRKLDFSEPVQGRVWKYYLLIYLLVYSTELATPRQEPIGAVTIPRCRLTTSPIRCGSLDTHHTTFMHSVEHGELSAMLLDPSMSWPSLLPRSSCSKNPASFVRHLRYTPAQCVDHLLPQEMQRTPFILFPELTVGRPR